MVEKLIKNGADVNIADGGNCKTINLCRGGTALHWAVNFGETWSCRNYTEIQTLQNGKQLTIIFPYSQELIML